MSLAIDHVKKAIDDIRELSGDVADDLQGDPAVSLAAAYTGRGSLLHSLLDSALVLQKFAIEATSDPININWDKKTELLTAAIDEQKIVSQLLCEYDVEGHDDPELLADLERRSKLAGGVIEHLGQVGHRDVLLTASQCSYKLINRLYEKLSAAVREHRDQRGDDRCWMDDEKIYAALPEGYTPPEHDCAVELENCKRYIASRHHPATTYVSPERMVELIREEREQAVAEVRGEAHAMHQGLTQFGKKLAAIGDAISRFDQLSNKPPAEWLADEIRELLNAEFE